MRSVPSTGDTKKAPLVLRNWTVDALLDDGERILLLTTAAFTVEGALQAGRMNIADKAIQKRVRKIEARERLGPEPRSFTQT